MGIRKIYCNVVEGVTYEDRCLFKLSKVIEGNPVCEDCTLRELLRLKRCGIKEAEARPVKKIKAAQKKKPKAVRRMEKVKEIKDANVSNDINVSNVSKHKKEPTPVAENSKQTYSVEDVSGLLGKSKRRTQELAKEGKIPAHKVGPHWAFDKEEIALWLSKKEQPMMAS